MYGGEIDDDVCSTQKFVERFGPPHIAFCPEFGKRIAPGEITDTYCAPLISQELRHSGADKPRATKNDNSA